MKFEATLVAVILLTSPRLPVGSMVMAVAKRQKKNRLIARSANQRSEPQVTTWTSGVRWWCLFPGVEESILSLGAPFEAAPGHQYQESAQLEASSDLTRAASSACEKSEVSEKRSGELVETGLPLCETAIPARLGRRNRNGEGCSATQPR